MEEPIQGLRELPLLTTLSIKLNGDPGQYNEAGKILLKAKLEECG